MLGIVRLPPDLAVTDFDTPPKLPHALDVGFGITTVDPIAVAAQLNRCR